MSWLHEHTWQEVESHLHDSDIVLIPCGATEQHGPHLPLGTDTFEAISVARAAAESEGVLVAPPVWCGWSPHHMGYPGTISLRSSTLEALAFDIGASLCSHGLRRLLFVNGHRGANLPPLELAAARLVEEESACVIVFDLALSARRGIAAVTSGVPGAIGHACEDETSHMLHIAGEHVREDRVPRAPDEADLATIDDPAEDDLSLAGFRPIDPAVASGDRAWMPMTARDFRGHTKDQGFTGHPWRASRSRGRAVHEAQVASLCRAIARLREADRSVS